jgi:hypothetical protein
VHPSWKPRGPEWAPLAPGVSFLIRPVTAELQAFVNAKVARAIGSLEHGRAILEDVGFEPDDFGALTDLDVLAGFSVMLSAIYYGEKLIEAWRGVDDAETGEPVPVTPETIRMVLRLGTPEGGSALMEPFLAWLDRPRLPIAGDQRRLRNLAKWEHGGGLAHCDGCDLANADCARGGADGGARCPRSLNAPQTEPGMAALAATRSPGVWRRAGMAGALIGLDYAGCLAIAHAKAGEDHAWLDEAALVRCLSAIEAGAIEAEMERANREKT